MSSAILEVRPLGFPWATDDPFLFCVHHDDAYPAGNEKLGPAASLAGRNIGMDFEGKDGWRMYHGEEVPGFPHHPHRGFETVTLVRRGYIDHSDSLNATARFGHGDAQWLTAGKGINHSEMFPLVDPKGPNPVELFQIWLNLPRASKMVDPYFSMFWNDRIPRHVVTDASGKKTEVTTVAGTFPGAPSPPAPPPDSWASRPEAHVAIWTLALEPGARFVMPRGAAGLNRTLFFFEGERLRIDGRAFDEHAAVKVRSDVDVTLENGDARTELLVLQGRPIGEPVVQHGPFVMNSRAEIVQAVQDYQRTQFGGWPFGDAGPVHPREKGRFARHADGRVEDADAPGGSK